MFQAATSATTAPCPRCRRDMVLAVVIPHPVAPQLARHTYLCADCNRTKTYILQATPASVAAGADDPTPSRSPAERRSEPREALAAAATLYDKGGSFLMPCTIRDLSRSGARLELSKEAALPQYFLLSMLPDGGGRRLSSKIWQLGLIVGVRFVERGAG